MNSRIADVLLTPTKKAALAGRPKTLKWLVGVTGFELATSTSRR